MFVILQGYIAGIHIVPLKFGIPNFKDEKIGGDIRKEKNVFQRYTYLLIYCMEQIPS
jgi:hypothetical protein